MFETNATRAGAGVRAFNYYLRKFGCYPARPGSSQTRRPEGWHDCAVIPVRKAVVKVLETILAHI